MPFLTDSEVAVVIDALDYTRDNLSGETPNIDSALRKINGEMRTCTIGIYFHAIDSSPSPFVKETL